MFKCHVSKETLNALDGSIELISKEMKGHNSEKVMALAKVLRDIVVARAILTERTDTLAKF